MDKIKNLNIREAAKKINQMINDIGVCMFFTYTDHTDEQGRPMAVAKSDESGQIWFLTNKKSNKVQDIQEDERVHLVFSHPGKEMFLDIYGDASISTNQKEIDELWTPLAKAWFPDGKTDPDICIIRVKTTQGNYWDTQHGKMVALMKMISAALTATASGDIVSGDFVISN